MRAILKVNRLTSTSWMLDTLKCLNIRERLQVNTIYFIRKMKIGNAPDYPNRAATLRWGGSTLQFEKRHGLQDTTSKHHTKNHCFIKD